MQSRVKQRICQPRENVVHTGYNIPSQLFSDESVKMIYLKGTDSKYCRSIRSIVASIEIYEEEYTIPYINSLHYEFNSGNEIPLSLHLSDDYRIFTMSLPLLTRYRCTVKLSFTQRHSYHTRYIKFKFPNSLPVDWRIMLEVSPRSMCSKPTTFSCNVIYQDETGFIYHDIISIVHVRQLEVFFETLFLEIRPTLVCSKFFTIDINVNYMFTPALTHGSLLGQPVTFQAARLVLFLRFNFGDLVIK